jgi:hypothetical protein
VISRGSVHPEWLIIHDVYGISYVRSNLITVHTGTYFL